MKRIASRDNPVFRSLRTLDRDRTAALLEGVHLCDAYLGSGGVPRQVVVGASALADGEVAALLDATGGVDCVMLDDPLFASFSGLAHGVAVAMVIDRPRAARPDRIATTSVLLDRVQDPGNVGSILRSAAAAGIGDVYLSAGCAGAWSPKVLRAGMGAHFHLRVFDDCDLATAKGAATIPWLATAPHAQRSIHDADLRGEVAWLFGHEGGGLDPALVDDATAVRIPQPGHGESLNVAASAAICFFEQVRQRAGSGH